MKSFVPLCVALIVTVATGFETDNALVANEAEGRALLMQLESYEQAGRISSINAGISAYVSSSLAVRSRFDNGTAVSIPNLPFLL